MKVTCIADLHGHYPELDSGDLLIIAGDLTARDQIGEYNSLHISLCHANYSKIIVIAGNHDNKISKSDFEKIATPDNRIEYLCDSGTEFNGFKVWGSPWTRSFDGMNPKCKAFTCETEEELAEKWALIPADTDIVITHSPPYGIYDRTIKNERVGSRSLLLRMAEIKPLLHVYGHIHEDGGSYMDIPWKNGTTFVNCSHVNERYEPVNKPREIDL